MRIYRLHLVAEYIQQSIISLISFAVIFIFYFFIS
nr:MAG TPA: hypothetical protein [Bacteriophage sp.]